MPVAGRCALVMMLVLLPYARNEDGLGSLFFERKPRAPAALSVVLLGIVGWFALASTGLYTVFATIVITLVLSAFFKMKLGGGYRGYPWRHLRGSGDHCCNLSICSGYLRWMQQGKMHSQPPVFDQVVFLSRKAVVNSSGQIYHVRGDVRPLLLTIPSA